MLQKAHRTITVLLKNERDVASWVLDAKWHVVEIAISVLVMIYVRYESRVSRYIDVLMNKMTITRKKRRKEKMWENRGEQGAMMGIGIIELEV